MKKKLKPLRLLKAKLDKVFSEWVRRRGADEGGTNTCVSCGALKHWKELQCGHYHSRRHLGTRWDEQNCHPQCMRCNVFLSGNYPAFSKFMFQKYSTDAMSQLEEATRGTHKLDREYYERMIALYQVPK